MNYSGTQAQDRDNALIAEVKTLTVDRLKQILREHGLHVSGVKMELQTRLIQHIQNVALANNRTCVDRIHASIRSFTSNTTNPYPSPYSAHTPASSASPQFTSPVPRMQISFGSSSAMSHSSYNTGRLQFKDSAFYKIVKPLTTVHECKARENTRDTARLTINLSQEVAAQLQSDPNLRIMVFCAGEISSSQQYSEIAFPHQVELKCNATEIKTNLRGLKNKPGSTRPADITHLIQKRAGYPNSVEMVYALTKTKFYLVVNLTLKKSMRHLLETLRKGRYISKDTVITETSDPDIVATSSKLSLKCPLSYTRIETPCRSIKCEHNRCFDAKSYLLLQEQAPTWVCPICDRSAPWENLVIDAYLDEILKTTPKNTEQVTVEADGKWHIQEETPKTKSNPRSTPSDDDDYDDDDDDDELIEISDGKTSGSEQPPIARLASSNTSNNFASTTMDAPRSNKRPREEVIDLTLSDDEGPPPAQVKRTFSSTTDMFNRPKPPENPNVQFHLPSPQIPPSFNFNRFSS